MQKIDIENTLANPLWRLSNLYKITTKQGQIVNFTPNNVQRQLLGDHHNRKIILKARQLGVTTFYTLYYLDKVLFTPNYKHHIIGENQDTSKKIFTNIVKFAFENLPKIIREKFETRTDKANELSVRYKGSSDYNWSTISTGTSPRGSTFQSLQISEFGKICNKYRQKAQEIVTGALNAIEAGQEVVIESTAEGNEGYFYEYCQQAEHNTKPKTKLDYSFHFFPWRQDHTYTLDDNITITTSQDRYFDKLALEHGIELTLGQKRRYTAKQKENGDDMKREFPSISKESFNVAIEGAYYESQVNIIRQQNRICNLPYNPLLMVNTCRDLGGAGGGDDCVIWRFQIYGQEIRRIDYREGSGYGLEEIIQNQIKTKEYKYNYHIAPHDIKVHEMTTAKTRLQFAQELGVKFIVCPSPPGAISDRIQATKRILGQSRFDETNTRQGFERVARYKRKYDERLGMLTDRPEHDQNSHASDSIGTGAVMIEKLFFNKDEGQSQVIIPKYNFY